MLCPSCNKFAANSTDNDPEVDITLDDVTVEDDTATAHIMGTVRIVITSECCGEELKEASFDVDVNIEAERAEGCTCDLKEMTLTDDSPTAEFTDRSDTHATRIAKRGPNKGQEVKTPIPYRFQKHYYGAAVPIAITCQCGATTGSEDWADEVQASGMDELI